MNHYEEKNVIVDIQCIFYLIRRLRAAGDLTFENYQKRFDYQEDLPLLLGGVLVGGNSLWANFFASIVGALMYFATLTEVPILQGLIGAGMG